ncbi:putative splicing factor 3A subunit 1 [Cyberlindnera fabianii]|uniref:Putative splicing factor 3A subunit 1 n=1 Tax=Cyberlindnera fabianii TaxID=36022 RepID=A0A1V2L9B4_CYBFA|nr:putative splicing factor 3A subunit 1 [Cyberlindnera fabianii]
MMNDIPEDIIIPPPAIRSMALKIAQYVIRNGTEFEEKVKQQPQSSRFTFLINQMFTMVIIKLDFLIDMPIITNKDLDILKLTAQFVAVNGPDYKQAIKNKYHDQILQFGFMDSQHSLNPLFEKYVDQYTRILNDDIKTVPSDEVLLRAYKRAEWETTQRDQQEKKIQDEEDKKIRFARVDWNDFSVVATIQFDEVDSITELEQPVTIEQLQLKSLDEKSKQVTAIKSDETPSGIKIKEFGSTRLKSIQKEKFLQCPLTGKMIPEKDFQRHIEILLRDPKYQDEKAKYEAKIQNTNLNPDEVAKNINALFKPHTQNKRQKVLWDGYQSSVDYVKSNQPIDQPDDEYKRKQQCFFIIFFILLFIILLFILLLFILLLFIIIIIIIIIIMLFIFLVI